MSPAGLAPSLPSAPGAPALGAAVVARANPAPYGWQAYVVRPADTLSEIALRTRTTTGTLIARNHLSGKCCDVVLELFPDALDRIRVPKTEKGFERLFGCDARAVHGVGDRMILRKVGNG